MATTTEYFDYETMARQAGILPAQLGQIVERVRRDSTCNPMRCELHILRTCRAIRDHRVTITQVLAEPATAGR